MLRCICRTAAALLATVLFPLQCWAAPTTAASSTLLMDGDTGAVLYEDEAHRQSLIASTTKILTAVVVLEHCDVEERFVIPAEASGIEGSSLYLKAGESLTLRELLYGLLLHSGNDAAIALALACSDSVPEFVALMNLKARKLGMKNSHFENPNGLDGEQHYSTAYDLGLLTCHALKIPLFREIVSTKEIRIGERSLRNHNKLLWQQPGAIGVKTGYTRKAGRILVSAAEQKGRCLIAVTLNDGNDWEDHKALYDYGFSFYEERCLIKKGESLGCVPLLSGGTGELLAGEDFFLSCMPSEQPKVRILYPKLGYQKEERNTFAGVAGVYLGDRELGKIQLLWGGGEDEGTDPKNNFCPRTDLPTER